MSSLLSHIVEKVNKSKINNDLKSWIVNELSHQPNHKNFSILYIYNTEEASSFHMTSISDISKYYNNTIRPVRDMDVQNISDSIKTIILCNPSVDYINKLKHFLEKNEYIDNVLVVENCEENFKSEEKFKYFNTENRSIKSIFRKMNMGDILEKAAQSDTDHIKSRINLINNRIDNYNVELRAKIYELQQNELNANGDAARPSTGSRDVKAKLKLQENIFKKSLDRSLQEYFGEQSSFVKELNSEVDKIEDLKENLKTKKNELSIPDETITNINNRFEINSKNFWNQTLETLNKYFNRNNNYVVQNLKSSDFNQSLRAKNNTETELYQKFINQSINSELDKITSEIGKKRIGDYLMRARMFPMYILMGSSMLGLSITRGSGAKFMAPIMIFLMGLGFYMIYNSRQKEEKDEKDKALANIKEKANSEISKRCKDFINLSKKYFESQIKSNDEDLLNFYERTTTLKSVNKPQRATSQKSGSKLSQIENQLKDTKDIKKELEKTMTRLR